MSHPRPDPESPSAEGTRLQKVLAAAGVGSRRVCEGLIAAGRVSVDGTVVGGQGLRVDPENAVVHVDGRRIALGTRSVHLVLNKSRGVLSTMSDDRGRPCVAEYVQDRPERLFHVGRLDADSEGVMLLTNDGDLAQRLSHPSFEVAKVYLAEVRGTVAGSVGRRLLAGVTLEDGFVRADAFRVTSRARGRTMVEVTLHSGRNRVVRRMLDAVDHPVTRLVRTSFGPIRLGELRSGTLRSLSPAEYADLDQLRP